MYRGVGGRREDVSSVADLADNDRHDAFRDGRRAEAQSVHRPPPSLLAIISLSARRPSPRTNQSAAASGRTPLSHLERARARKGNAPQTSPPYLHPTSFQSYRRLKKIAIPAATDQPMQKSTHKRRPFPNNPTTLAVVYGGFV